MAQEWSILATILLTSVVSILLTASALELAAEEEIDLNPDLALAFHRYLICLLSERLTSNSKLLRGVIE